MAADVSLALHVYRTTLYLFGCLSLALYIRVIWIITTERRRNPIFRNFFFKIFLMEAVTDICSFLIVFFLAIVRKYRLITAVDDFCKLHQTGIVPTLTVFMLTSTRGTLYFGPLWFALNRLTTFTSTSGKRLQQWQNWHLVICILVEISPFAVGAHLYLSNSGTISFVFLNSNLMLIAQPLAVTKRASAYHTTISIVVGALSFAAYLYILATLRLKRNRRNINLAHARQERFMEMRLLCFSIVQFIVFVLNCTISILLTTFSVEQHGSTVVKEIWCLLWQLMHLPYANDPHAT